MKASPVSILAALADPHRKQAMESQYLQACLAQARHEQVERQHNEKLAFERERQETGIRAAESKERISGENALAMLARTFLLTQAGNASALIDQSWTGLVRQEEEWNRVFSGALAQLVTTEADSLRQARLKEQEQRHLVERLLLERRLKTVEMVLTHELLNSRVAFDRTADIVFRLVERAAGLGTDEVSDETMRVWVREAMEQAGEY